MTCQEAGIYQCCSDRDGQCVVWHPDTNDANGGYTKHCYCDAVCHERNDCCPDVVEIGCKREKLYAVMLYIILQSNVH